MAISIHCNVNSKKEQVINSDSSQESLDFCLPALWTWMRAHPDCSYLEFRTAYFRARLLANRSIAISLIGC